MAELLEVVIRCLKNRWCHIWWKHKVGLEDPRHTHHTHVRRSKAHRNEDCRVWTPRKSPDGSPMFR